MPITLGLAQTDCQDGIGSALKSEVWLLIRLLTFPELLLCVPGAVPAHERCHHNVGVRHSHGFWESLSVLLGTGAPLGGHRGRAGQAGKRQRLRAVTGFSLLFPARPMGLLLGPYSLPDRFMEEWGMLGQGPARPFPPPRQLLTSSQAPVQTPGSEREKSWESSILFIYLRKR